MNNSDTNIVIIGSGKATFLHINAILKIWKPYESPTVFIQTGNIVDPDLYKIVSKKEYPVSFIAGFDSLSLDTHKTIIDICTPTAIHRDVVEKAICKKFTQIMIEKPVAMTRKDLEWLESLNVHIKIVENYLYSQATLYLHHYITTRNLYPIELYSFFCKNRTEDCKNGRGYHMGIPPHVYTIEMPHQLYLSTFFFKNTNVLSSTYNGMFVNENYEPKLGAGYIELEHGSVKNGEKIKSYHFSCLNSEFTIKCLYMKLSNGANAQIYYPVSRKQLLSNVIINLPDSNVIVQNFQQDDMIKRTYQNLFTALIRDNKGEMNNRANLNVSNWLVVEAIERGRDSSDFNGADFSICKSCTQVRNLLCMKRDFGGEPS